MNKFIVFTFLMLALGFHKMSSAAEIKLPNFTDTAEIIPASLKTAPTKPDIVTDRREVSGMHVNMLSNS